MKQSCQTLVPKLTTGGSQFCFCLKNQMTANSVNMVFEFDPLKTAQLLVHPPTRMADFVLELGTRKG